MRIGSRYISIPFWALCAYVLVASCMLWLGNWQLNRAALKVQMQQAAAQAKQSKAVPLADVEDLINAAANYERVVVEGVYLYPQQFLWDNRTHKGQAGFEVLSLVRLKSGGLVLINRGWVPLGASREQLPDVAMPPDTLAKGMRMEGFASLPSKGFASGPAVQDSEQWPKLLQYVDYEQIAAAVGEPVLAVVVQAQALDNNATGPTVLTERPEWLTANWQPAASGPAKHYSYAFQWFAMAVALTIITVVVNFRRQAKADN